MQNNRPASQTAGFLSGFFFGLMKMTRNIKNLVTLKYKDHLITFNKDGWINATDTSRKFGKRIDNWMANAETKEYIDHLAEFLTTCIPSELVITKQGRNGGTWLHPKLSVAFARWLDVRFSVWCDMQIDEMLFGKGRAMQNLLEATKALDTQIEKGSDAGRGLALHKYAKPPLEAQVEYWRNEVQLSLRFEP